MLSNAAPFFIGRLIVALVIASGISGNALGVPWRGVVPLHSTKAQARAKLGKPTHETSDRMEFTTRDGKAVIFFYTTEDTQNLKLAPSLAGKVLTIYVYPKRPRSYDPAQLKKRTRTVGRGVTSEGETMVSYDDGERGISYHFKKEENKVWRIVYYAPRAEFARFKLEEPAK